VAAPSVSVTDAVALAAKAGGVAVLAHPGRLAPTERDRVLGEALAAGVDGVEVWHSQHDAELRRFLAALTERHGLLATGGSDYHGRHKPGVRVGTGTGGNVAVPGDRLAALRERLASSGPAA
jgi:3',5'-nucleoside bisphosphate phosphatase